MIYTADKWTQYELIDADAGQRLERYGDVIMIRPDPQVIWSGRKKARSGNVRTEFTRAHLPAAANGQRTKCLSHGMFPTEN